MEAQIGEAKSKKKSRLPLTIMLIVLALLIIVVDTQIGVYTIQPIGAIPDGRTTIVWRNSGEPFFNSPDGMCLKIQGSVSLMCRMVALGEAPVDRIIIRLPYIHQAYLQSTGLEFDG